MDAHKMEQNSNKMRMRFLRKMKRECCVNRSTKKANRSIDTTISTEKGKDR